VTAEIEALLSPGTRIRDAIIARARRMRKTDDTPFFTTIGQNPADGGTLQPEELDFIGVFAIRDRMKAHGDPRSGMPRFDHEATIGISIATSGATPTQAENDVQRKTDVMLWTLFTDPTFVTFNPRDHLFDGIESVERTRLFPRDGDTFFIEERVAITFLAYSSFEPRVEDDYMRTVLTVQQPQNPQSPTLKVVIDQAV
jgi:hypothetical protein